MKTENMDDAFRKKLESIHQQPTDDEIQKVHRHVTLNRGGMWSHLRFRYMVALSVCGMLVLGLVTWNVSQLHERKIMVQTIDTLKRELAETQTVLSGSRKAANTVSAQQKPETGRNMGIAIAPATSDVASQHQYASIRHTGPEVWNKKEPAGNFHNTAEEGSRSMTDKTILNQDKDKSFIRRKEYTSGQVIRTNSSTAPAIGTSAGDAGKTMPVTEGSTAAQKVLTENKNQETNSKTDAGITVNQPAGKNNNAASAPVQTEKTNEPAKPDNGVNNNAGTGKDQLAGSDRPLKSSNAAKEESTGKDTKNAKVKIVDPAKSVNEKAAAKNTVKRDSGKENAKNVRLADSEDKQKKSFSLTKGPYLAGLEVARGNNQLTAGIVAEAYIAPRLSISTGIRWTRINNERYRNDSDLLAHRGNILPGGADTLSRNANIALQYGVIQLPVAITYHLPLKNNFSLMFSTGTSLDLYASQRTDFDHFDPRTPYDERRSQNTHIPALLFNNAMLSVGIQKQWGHFVLDASPYISYQLIETEYKKDDIYAGLRIRALYSFGK